MGDGVLQWYFFGDHLVLGDAHAFDAYKKADERLFPPASPSAVSPLLTDSSSGRSLGQRL